MDRCHLIPQQLIRQTMRSRGVPELLIDEMLRDERIIVDGCRCHHNLLDNGAHQNTRITLELKDHPEGCRDWAIENHFFWTGDSWRPSQEAWEAAQERDDDEAYAPADVAVEPRPPILIDALLEVAGSIEQLGLKLVDEARNLKEQIGASR